MFPKRYLCIPVVHKCWIIAFVYVLPYAHMMGIKLNAILPS